MTTTYNVHLNILSSGGEKAKASITGIGSSAKEAEKQLNGLYSGMKSLALVGLGIGAVAYKATSWLVGMNKEVENTKIGLATMINMNLGGSFESAEKKADSLFKGLKEDAKKLPGTTKDFTEMAQGIASGVLGSGGTLSTLRTMTGQAVTAGKIFSIESGEVARDVQQAMMGTLGAKDKFSRLLLTGIGVDYQKFNKLTQTKRLETYQRALAQPSLASGMKKYENSWEGVSSTFESNITDVFKSASKPLTLAIGNELKKWNEWLDKNPGKIAEFGQKFTDALMTGFEYAKKIGESLLSAGSWISENKSLLLAFLPMLAGKFAGNNAGSKGVAGFMAGKALGQSNFEAGITSMLTAVNGVPGPLGILASSAAAAGSALGGFMANLIDQSADQSVRLGRGEQLGALLARTEPLLNQLNNPEIKKRVEFAQLYNPDVGPAVPSPGPAVDELLAKQRTGLQYEKVWKQTATEMGLIVGDAFNASFAAEKLKFSYGMSQTNANGVIDLLTKIYDKAKVTAEKEDASKKVTPKNQDHKVHLILEVAAEDPDRYVLNMNNAFNQGNVSATMATPRRR